ncbi:hypothetical protein [Phyllobacterium phragmitis]|uniref:hypothetical protein n=1 Tax=Phyllobacterium phragmitis TaxID=2670329 RepID=UPI0011B1D9F3|nr:hypothetical protein [Phyllobacterium phragmitis]
MAIALYLIIFQANSTCFGQGQPLNKNFTLIISTNATRGSTAMSWFRNHYICEQCDESWNDEWSCACDDDCQSCGARHFSPYHSDDLSVIIEEMGDGRYAVLYSPSSAEHNPDYRTLAEVTGNRLAKMIEEIAINLTADGFQWKSN